MIRPAAFIAMSNTLMYIPCTCTMCTSIFSVQAEHPYSGGYSSPHNSYIVLLAVLGGDTPFAPSSITAGGGGGGRGGGGER